MGDQVRPGRDTDRAQVYAAELMAFDGTDLESVETFEVVAAFVNRITGTSWWPGGSVAVRTSRADARSSSARRSGVAGAEIRLAPDQCTRATAVHELAHVLAGVHRGHDSSFRRAHVDVASEAFGAERGGWLADAYEASGLALAERRWAVPPSILSGGAIAL